MNEKRGFDPSTTQLTASTNDGSLNRKAAFSTESAGTYVIVGLVRGADGTILIQSKISAFANCVPSRETCDGIDNDCNGIVDEGCECSTDSDCNFRKLCIQGLCTTPPPLSGLQV